MNRAQRRAHARLWPLLMLIMAAAIASALIVKARVDHAAMQAAAAQSMDE